MLPHSYRFELSQGSSSGAGLITVMTPDGRSFWHVTPPPAALNAWAKQALWCIGRTLLDTGDSNYWRLVRIRAHLERRPVVLSRFREVLKETYKESSRKGSNTCVEEVSSIQYYGHEGNRSDIDLS